MSRITMTVLSVLILISACTSGSKTGTNRQLPVYLDESKTIDERVEDIIPRLTLEERWHYVMLSPNSVLPECNDSAFLSCG